MRGGDYISLAWLSLKASKGRSIGAIIGIVIAVGALGAALGIGFGFQHTFETSFARLFGATEVYLTGTTLTMADLSTVEHLPYVANVIPLAATTGAVNIGGQRVRVTIVGTTQYTIPALIGATSLSSAIEYGAPTLVAGSAIIGNGIAIENGAQVVSPGQLLTISAGGKTIPVIVTGILVPSASIGAINPDTSIFMDQNSFFQYFDPAQTYNAFIVYALSPKYVQAVVDELQAVYPTATIINPSSITSSFNQFMGELELFLGAVASIGFLITGLWIFDSMTISVMQRTREFGVMKALGFGNKEIFLMLMVEITMLSLMGAAGGLLVLLGLMRVVSLSIPGGAFRITPVLSPLVITIIVLLPVAINILAAFLPAYRAARIPPAQTLRYE
ncbi:MAG: ABC transporter permease [Thermocladium sp.]